MNLFDPEFLNLSRRFSNALFTSCCVSSLNFLYSDADLGIYKLLHNLPNTLEANMDFNIFAPENGIAPQGRDLDFDFLFNFDLYDNTELGNGTYDLLGNNGPDPGLARRSKATNVPERSGGTENMVERPSWAVSSAGDVPPTRASAKAQGESIFLGKILEVLPDISHGYVKNLYEKHKQNLGPGQDVTAIIEPAVDQILADGTYPKQENRKRKRAPADSESDSEEITRSRNVEGYSKLALVTTASSNSS